MITNQIDIKTKKDLREYFVLTTVMGVGLFLTIYLFVFSIYYQARNSQRNLEHRSMRVQDHIRLILDQHDLGLRYIDKRLAMGAPTNESLIDIADGFLGDSLFESIDLVSYDINKDTGVPRLNLLHSDSKDAKSKGILFDSFLKKFYEFEVSFYNIKQYQSFVYCVDGTVNCYVGLVHHFGEKNRLFLISWIPLQKVLPPPFEPDQPLSITFTNSLYAKIPSVQADSDKAGFNFTVIESQRDYSRSLHYTTSYSNSDEVVIGSNLSLVFTFASEQGYAWSWLVLVSGLSISVLLSLLFFNLINRNIEVQTLVEEKTQDVIKASNEALKANEIKTRFLANISHEIRTPLNIILGMADLLGETDLSRDQKKYVDSFKKSGTHLLDLINDVIDIIRLEADDGQFEDKDFNVSELVQEVCSLCAVASQNKRLDFSYYIDPEVPYLVSGDPKRLKQILLNLINNAIKFTDSGFVRVHVSTSNLDRSSAYLQFVIEDSGIGITKLNQAKLFNPFTQVDPSSTRNKGGVGLGLSIVKTIVHKLGGHIAIESKTGIGTRFITKIPYNVIEGQTWIHKMVQENAGLTGKKALLLTGDNFGCRLTKTILEKAGAQVEMCSSVFLFLKNFQSYREEFEIFICDLESLQSEEMAFFSSIATLGEDKRLVLLSPTASLRHLSEEIEKLPAARLCYKPVHVSGLLAAVAPPSFNGAEDAVTVAPVDKDSFKGLKLLVVEDDYENRMLMQAYIKDFDVQVLYADSGREAMGLYQTHQPHVVITDIQMPEMDGFKLTSLIRAYEKEQEMKASVIYALSADALPEHRLAAKSVGIDKYLTKPINKADFIKNIVEARHEYFESQAWTRQYHEA